MIPYDYSRCKPIKATEQCENCKRWLDHPKQRNNPHGQSVITVTGPKDEACHYMPISLLEKP